jgi:FixJ family two-component response regulator
MSDEAIVYIVDDDELLRKALERLISSVGLPVQTFATPAAFLAHPLPDRPAGVVLDVRMPGTSGLTVQEELTRTGNVCPILFLTGHADVPTSVRAMKAGAVDFIEKPFNDQALLDAVHRALDQARERRALRRDRQLVERKLQTLTSRERDVFALVVVGLPNKLVADRLGASEKTIKVHRARVMEKMQAESLADLVRMAHVAGLAGKAGARPAGEKRRQGG